MKIIFLRHPQTIANEMGYIYGKKDYPYTDLGKWQLKEAVALAGDFQYELIVSSPLGRAKTLAEAVSFKYGRELVLDEALEEMGYGILEGMTVEEGKEKHPEVIEDFLEGDPAYTIPEGEDAGDFEARVCDFIDRCLSRNQDVLIVSHGGVIRTAIEYLLDAEPGFSWQIEVGNGSFIEIQCDEGYNRLKTLVNID